MPGYHIYCEYYEKSLPYYWTVLDELISDIVIVWGRKVWGYLPIEGWVSSMTVLREDSVISLLFFSHKACISLDPHEDNLFVYYAFVIE